MTTCLSIASLCPPSKRTRATGLVLLVVYARGGDMRLPQAQRTSHVCGVHILRPSVGRLVEAKGEGWVGGFGEAHRAIDMLAVGGGVQVNGADSGRDATAPRRPAS